MPVPPHHQASLPEPVPLCTTLIPHLTILYRNLADPAPYPTPLCRVAAQAGVGCRMTCISKVKDKIKLSPTVLVLPHRITHCIPRHETPSALTSNCCQQRIMYHIVYHHIAYPPSVPFITPNISTVCPPRHGTSALAVRCCRCAVVPFPGFALRIQRHMVSDVFSTVMYCESFGIIPHACSNTQRVENSASSAATIKIFFVALLSNYL